MSSLFTICLERMRAKLYEGTSGFSHAFIMMIPITYYKDSLHLALHADNSAKVLDTKIFRFKLSKQQQKKKRLQSCHSHTLNPNEGNLSH